MSRSRLLIVNNYPSFYRTSAYAAMIRNFERRTGGEGMVAYQFRRNPAERAEWFFTPDGELPYPHTFLQEQPASDRTSAGGLGARFLASYRPTHIFTAGWDVPLSFAASQFARLPSRRLGIWVESSRLTVRRTGAAVNRVRRIFMAGADFAVVPSPMSEAYVHEISGRALPCVRLLNPVELQRIPDSPRGSRRLVFLGDLSVRKGFDRLAEAATILAAEGWQTVAWGRDTDGLGKTASAIVQPGARPFSRIQPDLRSTDILVVPSRVDPAPLIYSEALALGLRAIVSDSIAYRDHAAQEDGVAVADCSLPGAIAQAARGLWAAERPSQVGSDQVRPEYFATKVLDRLLEAG